jgi:hypothetical protein
MARPAASSVQKRFTDALQGLVEQMKDDRSILAAILCGSLSHDRVWDKSDVDLLVITIDDKKVQEAGLALYADGVNVHALLVPRSEFRKTMDGVLHNSFIHSFVAKGRLLYTHDPTLADICERLKSIGERDTQLQLLNAGCHALGPIYKAHKWMLTRGDLEYTALWILYAATSLARIEVIGRRMIADREVIPQAMKLNPRFFKLIYSDLLNNKKSRSSVQAALDAIDKYVADRVNILFGPVLEHLREVREARSATELENHFKRNFGIEGVTIVCEYLSDQKLIGKASTPVQLTKRSNISVQELAFFHLGDPDDGF